MSLTLLVVFKLHLFVYIEWFFVQIDVDVFALNAKSKEGFENWNVKVKFGDDSSKFCFWFFSHNL